MMPRLGVFLFAAAVATGCIDLSPGVYDAPETSLPDASSDGALSADALSEASLACAACLQTTCAAANAKCTADPKCTKFSACMTATQCWSSSFSDLAHLMPCVIQCGITSGINSQNDPAAALAAQIDDCAQNTMTGCAAVCDPGAIDL